MRLVSIGQLVSMERKYMSDESDQSGDRGDWSQWGKNTQVIKVIIVVIERTGFNRAKLHK